MTPLGRKLRWRIAANGPLTVADYMAACLADPEHGYYLNRDPLGLRGDFTTAPEISQLFGEMIGVWLTATWQALGSPPRVKLVELGPGRGTLMADVLRVVARQAGLAAATDLHLVEISPALRKKQQSTLAGSGFRPTWHSSFDDVPAGPALIVANEFFDALPIRQFSWTGEQWQERLIDLAGERFVWALSGDSADVPLPPGQLGDVLERSDAAVTCAEIVGARIARHGGAMLAIDYGYGNPQFGDTFQALANHVFVDPLAAPGEADVTAHVDFAALADAFRRSGAAVHRLLTQATFLYRLGIEARAMRLAHGNPAKADDVLAGLARLTDDRPGGMGRLFKVLAVSSPGITPPGFQSADHMLGSTQHDSA